MTLLARSRRGERAFERLYRKHVADVYRYALVLLRSPEDAEAVTQTTFLNAYRAFARGERPRNSRAWLLALAHGVCRRRVRAAGEVDLDDDFAARAVPYETPPTPAEIRRALARLPFNQRAALAMRELESRPYREIALVLELTPAAVESLVFEGRRALREQLAGALTCHEAERAISRQIDGRLARSERRPLRKHLRECDDCAGFARSQRAQRPAWKTLASVPLPASLQSFFGPGGVMDRATMKSAGVAAVGALAKTVAIAAIGASVVGLAYESVGKQDPESAGTAVVEHVGPRPAQAEPVGRSGARLVRARPGRGAMPARAKPRVASSSTASHRARSRPKAVAPSVPAPSQALQVRARAGSKPVHRAQTAASPRRVEPATAAPPEVAATTIEPSPPPMLALPQSLPSPPVALPVLPALP
jgi:RNA polymerase sigma factor (sigma-70 family)